jgi:hypothetical protein
LTQTISLLVWNLIIKLLLLVVGTTLFFGFLSTSDFNQSLFVGGLPGWFTEHSPATLEPININGCTN